MRRIVTGRNHDDKSVFVADEDVDHELAPSGGRVVRIWGDDETAALPTDGTPPTFDSLFPPAGGYRVLFSTLIPGARRPKDMPADAHAQFEDGDTGMHTSATVDVCLVIDGEVYIELDDGAEKLLSPGDVLIQNGTRHAWHNRSDRECTVMITMIGATVDGA